MRVRDGGEPELAPPARESVRAQQPPRPPRPHARRLAESECHSPYCVTNQTVGQALRNFSAYNARWPMPSPESGGVLAMWHSYDVAGVHWVAIDTSTDFPDAPEGTTGDSHMPWFPAGSFAPEGAYMAWLEADLAKAAAAVKAGSGTNFIVAYGHRPFEDLPAAHAAQLDALFVKYGVSFYFCGCVALPR